MKKYSENIKQCINDFLVTANILARENQGCDFFFIAHSALLFSLRLIYFEKTNEMWPKTKNIVSLKRLITNDCSKKNTDNFFRSIEAKYRCSKHTFGRMKIKSLYNRESLLKTYEILLKVVDELQNIPLMSVCKIEKSNKLIISDFSISSIIKQFANNLIANDIFVASIIIYGSYAKGNANINSDIDLIILGQNDSIYKNELNGLLIKYWPDPDVKYDYLVLTIDDFKILKSENVLGDILKTSKKIWNHPTIKSEIIENTP